MELRVYQQKECAFLKFPNICCVLCVFQHDTFSESGGGVQVSSPVFHGKQIQEQDESELTFPSVCVRPLEM